MTSRAAAIAVSTAAARTSAAARASAWAMRSSAMRRRRASDCSRSRAACAASRSASALAWATIAWASLDRLAFLTLIIGQQPLRFLAQSPRFFELVPDANRALVESAGYRTARRLPHKGDKDHQREEHPEMVIVQQFAHQRACPARTLSTAAVSCAGSARRRSASQRPPARHRAAIPRTSASACCFVSAMRRSASSICWASAAANARWRSPLGGEPVGRLLDRRLGLRPRLRHRALKGSVGRLRFGLQPRGARQIVFAALPARLDRGRQLRQPDPRHQDVEDDERDREPEQLRREVGTSSCGISGHPCLAGPSR